VVDLRPLLEGVRMAARIAPVKNALPVATCVLLEAKASSNSLDVTATDLHTTDVVYRVPARVRRSGRVAISARRLCEYLEAVDGEADELLLATSPTRLVLHLVIGRFRARFATQPPDELPLMSLLDVVAEYRVDPQLLAQLIKRTAFAALPRTADRTFGNVLVEISDGQLTLVGADGYRLAYATAEIDSPDTDEDVQLLGPKAAAEELARALAHAGADQLRLRTRADGGQLEVGSDTFQMVTRCLQTTFPDYRSLLDVGTSQCRAMLTSEELRQAAATQTTFCSPGERLGLSFRPPHELEIESGRALQTGDETSARNNARVGMTGEPSITLTIAEASKLLGVSVWLGRRLARGGTFPGAFRVGGVYRVHRATFEHEVGRLASGQTARLEDPDEVLQRALGDVSMRLARRRVQT
jgi:DNA polymerase III sliding clamp (beta) subunit (PCNA family)